jgi:histidinol phosphatase-like enzyme
MSKSVSDFKKKIINDDKNIIAIDFDGVIHKNSKGFHDGTIYDGLVDNTVEALEFLSQHYELVIYTCKANPDRPLVNGKTGKQLIKEWLIKKKIDHFFNDIYYEKPNAKFYIDDKAIAFKSWEIVINKLKKH